MPPETVHEPMASRAGASRPLSRRAAPLVVPPGLGTLVRKVTRLLQPPPRRPALPAPKRLAAAPAMPAEAPESPDRALLRRIVAFRSFAGYTQITALREAQERAGDVAADPPAARAAEPGPRVARALEPVSAAAPGAADAIPISRYLAQVAALRGVAETLVMPHEAVRLALWYARTGPEALRGTAPVDAALAAELNADASTPWEGRGRLSRLMAAMGGAPAAAEGPEALADWWFGAAGALPGCLTPDWLADWLVQVPPAGAGSPFALGARLLAIHGRSESYRQTYALSLPEGRAAFVFDLLLHVFDTPTRRLAFNPGALAWFACPLDGAVGAPSRFEALVAAHAGRALPAAEDGAAVEALRHWFRTRVCRVHPAFAAFATLPQSEWIARDTTLELVGMARSSTGLGQNLGMSAAALGQVGVAHRLRDSEDGFAPLASAGSGPRPRRPRRKAMLLHMNADQAPQALCHPLFDRHADLHAIGFFLWELEALPAAHRLALDLVDEIWCPSRFLAEVFARHTDRPVHWVGKAISLPAPRIPARRRFGLASSDFVFLTCFDFHSSVERKNPMAAVEAFQRAFPPRRCALVRGPRSMEGAATPRLVIKTTPPVAGHWGDPNGTWPRIEAAAAADPRIVIIRDHLAFAELIGLIALADALISPHRAEGFGYLPAFALSLARPVLATDYGGTTDFVRPETGFPVTWRPRGIAPGETILPVPGGFWADIDRDALAEAMTGLIERPEEGRRRALAGQRLIARDYAPTALAERYRARLRAAGILG